MLAALSPSRTLPLFLAVALSAAVVLQVAGRSATPPCPSSGVTELPAHLVELSAPGVAHSSVCAQCHSYAPTASGLKDAEGNNVAPYDLWQGTMMANAARDPLWQAVMSVEIAAMPHHRDKIEAECLNCHAPMATRVGLQKEDGKAYSHLLRSDTMLGQIAQDGVSCTICHGIEPGNLGSEESFTAGFELSPDRLIYGPFEDPLEPPMRTRAGFTPTHGPHIRESALCGSCHTLITPVFNEDGEETGLRFLEQAPYLEWRNSVFQTEDTPGEDAASCQDCHVGRTNPDGSPIETRIARNPAGNDFPPTRPRSPFGRHDIVGGNTLVLGMFRDHGEELGATAPSEAFAAVFEATREQLRERSASLSLVEGVRDGGQLRFGLEVVNRTGHKLPTAHPTRRAWMHVRVTDASGEVVYENGRPDERGRIVGSGGKPLASELAGGPIQPHRSRLRDPNGPAIYQGIMADVAGEPTFVLLQGASWLKDTRILPRGWSPDHAEGERTAPIGTTHDDDFVGGSDRLDVLVDLPDGAQGPFRVEARLLFQTLSARWAAEMFTVDTPEVARFRELYESADLTPEVLATCIDMIR